MEHVTISEMSNDELRTAIAVGMGWQILRDDGRGEIIARMPGIITAMPLRVPDWAANIEDAKGVEKRLKLDGSEAEYMRQLAVVVGSGSPELLGRASARQRCEAALAVMRRNRK